MDKLKFERSEDPTKPIKLDDASFTLATTLRELTLAIQDLSRRVKHG